MPLKPSMENLSGKWNVIEYETRGDYTSSTSYNKGEWTLEFDPQGQLTQYKSSMDIHLPPKACRYEIKNTNELLIFDFGISHPYKITSFTKKKMVMENTVEKMVLVR